MNVMSPKYRNQLGHCPPKEGPHSFLKGIEDVTAAARKL
jgi:hypothetical protein